MQKHGLKIKNVYKSSTDILGIIINVFCLNGLIPQYNNNIVPGGWYIGTLVILYLMFPITYFILKKENAKLQYATLIGAQIFAYI